MCGLAGFYPKKGKKVNINKLYLLGIINEDRGTDSCGLSIGGTRITGTNLNKKARDFITSEYKDIEKIPMLNKPCIFHTRKSTLGAHNLDNCHPFVYSSADGINHFALAHNGIVSNIYDIKREFLKDVEDVDKMLHIDSHYLALSLGRAMVGKADEKSILKYYKGSAALLYYNNDCFKAWKGANNNVEERPLYYIETPSGWYFGSIRDALYLVFDRLYEVKEVQNNELLTFHKHTLEKSEIVIREQKEEKTIYCGGAWDYDYNKRYLPVTSPTRTNDTIIKNIVTSKPFYDSPVGHPRLNIFHCKYTDMNNGKPIDGEFKCVSNPNATAKEMYTIFSKKSSMENKVTFVDGILVNDKYIFNAIRSRFFNKGISVDKFFNAEKNRLANTVIDFMPLFRNKELYAVIYRKPDKTLDYITKYDNTQVNIRPLFGPLPVTLIADGSSISLTNNLYHD